MYGYIYLIYNLINTKIYIGLTTKTIQERFEEHRKEAVYHKVEGCRYLNNAIRKYGIENFLIQMIDFADDQINLNFKEDYWIETFCARNSKYGYNIKCGWK